MKNLLLVLLLYLPSQSFGIVNEIALDFGYDRQIYGLQRQNSIITRTYSAALSTYIFDYTAIDLSASKSQDITTENQRYAVATGIDLVGQQSRISSTVYGLGIKQMFAPRSAWIIPGISLGYARQSLDYRSYLTIENTTTKAQTVLDGGTTQQKIDSVFGTFSLQFKMTERLSLKASVKTLFPAFEFNKARDNIKYSFGFSWIF